MPVVAVAKEAAASEWGNSTWATCCWTMRTLSCTLKPPSMATFMHASEMASSPNTIRPAPVSIMVLGDVVAELKTGCGTEPGRAGIPPCLARLTPGFVGWGVHGCTGRAVGAGLVGRMWLGRADHCGAGTGG